MSGRPPGCERLEYQHLRPINRFDRGERVVTARDWALRIVAALVIALVGGMVGALFGDWVEGAVRESRLGRVEVEQEVARVDRASLHQEIANIRADVMGALGRIEGRLEILQRSVDKQ